MNYSRIRGTGSYLPETILSNNELSKQVDTSHEWIVDSTGIENRHIVSASETTTSMAVQAAKKAMITAEISPQSIDMVVVATCTPDKFFPSTACVVQHELGIPACPAFDIQAACSGFVYGLSVVDQFIKTGAAKCVLLIGSEAMSRVIDWQDRRTCILFGDGAGAVIFEASEEPGILATHISADGRQKDILFLDNLSGATINMQGNAVFKHAVNMLDEVAVAALKKNHLTIADIDWLVPHQANIRIIKATADKLGLSMDKVILTLKDQGNTSGASIPLALDAGIRESKIIRGQNLLLEAFGGGLTWGTALIHY